jgi:hypothetical protein
MRSLSALISEAGFVPDGGLFLQQSQTKGRGKLGPAGKQSVPIKDIWLYTLCRQFKQQLTR